MLPVADAPCLLLLLILLLRYIIVLLVEALLIPVWKVTYCVKRSHLTLSFQAVFASHGGRADIREPKRTATSGIGVCGHPSYRNRFSQHFRSVFPRVLTVLLGYDVAAAC